MPLSPPLLTFSRFCEKCSYISVENRKCRVGAESRAGRAKKIYDKRYKTNYRVLRIGMIGSRTRRRTTSDERFGVSDKSSFYCLLLFEVYTE